MMYTLSIHNYISTPQPFPPPSPFLISLPPYFLHPPQLF